MKKQNLIVSKIVYGILAICLLIALWITFKEHPVKVEMGKVVQGDFEENLRTEGITKALKKITLHARASGDLARVDLLTGENLKKNQKISELVWDFREPINSPIDGIVAKVFRESAGPINRGEPILEIIDPRNYHIEAEVLTTDALRISVGASVKIYGFNHEKEKMGQVKNISRSGFKKLSALGIEEEKTTVYIKLQDPQLPFPGDNFHVDLDILINEVKNAMKVPIGAIFKVNDQWAVFSQSNKRALLKYIQILYRNDLEVVIKQDSQLKTGDQVILFPSEEIHNGTLIKMD